MVLLCFVIFFSQMKIALTSGTSLQDRMLRYLNIKHKKVCFFACLFSLPLAIASAYSVLKHWNNRLLSPLNSCSKNVPASVWSEHQTSRNVAVASRFSKWSHLLLLFSVWVQVFSYVSHLTTAQSAVSQQADSTVYQCQNISRDLEKSYLKSDLSLFFFLQLTNIYFQFLCITCNSLPQ